MVRQGYKPGMANEAINQTSAIRQELSDEKFIAWSKSTFEDSYDVVALSNYLSKSDKDSYSGLDIGGGIGLFANTVIQSCTEQQVSFTVVDPGHEASLQRVKHSNINYVLSTFDDFTATEQYDFVVFRLVLHHLIGNDAEDTYNTQKAALHKAKSMLKEDGFLFVVENFYEPIFGNDITSKLIYQVTCNKTIAKVTRKLGANTAGEGVRFRSTKGWTEIFDQLGFKIIEQERHPWWGVDMPLWQRVPLLCDNRFQAASVLTR